MTDLIDRADTGEIPAPTHVGEATENLAPYAAGLRPQLRSADGDRPAWAEPSTTLLPTITIVPDLDSGLPALTYGTETERLTVLESLGADDGWVSLPPERPERGYAGRHRDPQGRIAVWGETSYEVLPAPEESHPVDVAPNPLKLGVGLMVGALLGAAAYAGLVMAALAVIR